MYVFVCHHIPIGTLFSIELIIKTDDDDDDDVDVCTKYIEKS